MTAPLGLAHLPTPLERLERLGTRLGLADLWVKRDDLTGLALGGNKARKLELLVAEALAAGCDVLVTGGGPQSNHARMSAAAANRAGLACHLALAADPPLVAEGNLLLDLVLGATLHPVGPLGYEELEAAIERVADELRAHGQHPLAIPIGGASTTGVVAYARAVDELREQLGADPDWIVVADGSGGTHAGLVAGLGPDSPTRVLGVDVGTRPALDRAVARLAADAAAADRRADPSATTVLVDHDHVGAGYGAVTGAAIEAIRTTARTEGIILDPVYTGKAMAALTTWSADGRIGRDQRVVFWHTGGTPALFAGAYADALEHG